jgi:hypothetical protein
MKTLHVMDLNFNYKAAIKKYESITLKRLFNGIGLMDIYISNEVPNANRIAEDDILYFNKEYHKAYIVDRIEIEGTPEQYIIRALSVKSLLEDYITVPPAGQAEDIQTGTREQIVRAWVENNCIPAQPDRPDYPIALGTLKGLGETTKDRTRYKNLAEEIKRVLSAGNLGWGLTLDISNKQFIFNVYEGVDRTKNASGYAPRVYFGLKYNNIQNPKQIKDQIGSKSIVYVAGQGEGADRNIIKVAKIGATRKREIFIDARDTNDTEELTERGNQKLAETAPIENFEFEVLNRQFKYESEYDLGDFVTVVIDKDRTLDLQIEKITEVYERNKIQVLPEFGKPEPTTKDIVGNIATRVSKLETKEVNKEDIGLSKVDNTADTEKPVSNPQQTALDEKSDKTHNHALNNLSEKSYNSLTDKPTSLPADGGNADTVDGKHASEFLLDHEPSTGIIGDDTRSRNYSPDVYMSSGARYLGRASAQSEFKYCSTIGVNGIIGSTYCFLMTYVPWSDGTGGYPIQMAMGSNGDFAIRTGTGNTAWGSWRKVWHTGNTIVDANGFIKEV